MLFGYPGYIEVLLITAVMSLASVLISKYMGDQRAVKNLKQEMKSLNERVRKSQKSGDTKEVSRLSSELMKLSGKQFQLNMKPMMITMVLFLGVFWFVIRAFYSEIVVTAPLNIPFVGNSLGWFYWYLLIAIPTGLMFRKLLAVE
jgi:uncharacterized membrane protein (DUF106 family)